MATTVTDATSPPSPARDYPSQCSTRCKQCAFIVVIALGSLLGPVGIHWGVQESVFRLKSPDPIPSNCMTAMANIGISVSLHDAFDDRHTCFKKNHELGRVWPPCFTSTTQLRPFEKLVDKGISGAYVAVKGSRAVHGHADIDSFCKTLTQISQVVDTDFKHSPFILRIKNHAVEGRVEGDSKSVEGDNLLGTESYETRLEIDKCISTIPSKLMSNITDFSKDFYDSKGLTIIIDDVSRGGAMKPGIFELVWPSNGAYSDYPETGNGSLYIDDRYKDRDSVKELLSKIETVKEDDFLILGFNRSGESTWKWSLPLLIEAVINTVLVSCGVYKM